MLPNMLYRRRMTNLYYTRDGQLFCNAVDGRLSQYCYSASMFDTNGEIELWRLRSTRKERT